MAITTILATVDVELEVALVCQLLCRETFKNHLKPQFKKFDDEWKEPKERSMPTKVD
jgi:hypothetical protein